MTISPFFRNLRTAYQAEIDDLAFDSDGHNVLTQRLKQRRKELSFLVSMLELSPEMVAVVLHKAFTFKLSGAIEHALQHEADDLPEWDSLADTITMAPWADELVKTILKQPRGAWFMTVAAALEYMYSRPQGLSAGNPDADSEDAEIDDSLDHTSDSSSRGSRPLDELSDTNDSDDDEDAERSREDAGADWMAEQGFDRKE